MTRALSAIAEIQPGMIDRGHCLARSGMVPLNRHHTRYLRRLAAQVCLEAIQAANRMGMKVSCDSNYRKSLWKYGKTASEVMTALMEGCDLILGNC